MAESYSERHGRKPHISVEALVELVFLKLRGFEQQGFFYDAAAACPQLPHNPSSREICGPPWRTGR